MTTSKGELAVVSQSSSSPMKALQLPMGTLGSVSGPRLTLDCFDWGGSEFFGKEVMGSLMEGDPIPLNFLILGQSLASDWVLDKFKEI